MKCQIFFTLFLSLFCLKIFTSEVKIDENSFDDTIDISLIEQQISESLPQFKTLLKNYLSSNDKQFLSLTNDSPEENFNLSFKCDYNDIVSGRCPSKSSTRDLCSHNSVPALIHGNSVIVLSNELITNAGLTQDKLKNMIDNGAITCVPNGMISEKPTQKTTTPSSVTSVTSSSSDDMNKIILLILLNLMNQNNNNNKGTQNPCPTCSCKHCGTSSSSSSNSGTDNAFSQLANAIIGMEQLKFDLIKNKINADAQILGNKLNIDMSLIKSKMGLQQALVNSLLGSLNSINSNQGSSHSKTSEKDSREQKNFNDFNISPNS
jgi:hypothetical protein